MRFFTHCLLAAAFLAVGARADAAWYEARSKHFVIYANESPNTLSDFANRLERFDRAVRIVRGEATLAEAELEADHPEAAEAAADRAIKAAPAKTEPLVLKGRAIMERAEKADADRRHVSFEQARAIFIAANKLDTEDPEPLMDFYYSYVRAGERPNANAIAALHYASDLAPQDLGLRMNSAIAYINERKLPEAAPRSCRSLMTRTEPRSPTSLERSSPESTRGTSTAP